MDDESTREELLAAKKMLLRYQMFPYMHAVDAYIATGGVIGQIALQAQ